MLLQTVGSCQKSPKGLIKLVFHRSNGINFNTFCAWLFDFMSSFVFYSIFLDFECHVRFHFASFFSEMALLAGEPPHLFGASLCAHRMAH